MATGQAILYKRVFVWSWLLRLFHIIFAVSIFILLITGTYIHHPPITTKWAEFNPPYLMATLRYYHFAAGYCLLAAILIRLYLLFFGKKHERCPDFLPVNKRNWRSILQELRFYLYFRNKHEWRMGHTVLAGCVYLVILISAMLMVLTGIYLLYPEVDLIGRLGLIFGPVQTARFVHYLLSWVFMLFILIHLYIAVWNDFKAPEAIISGMVSGVKFMPSEEREE